MTPPRVGDVAGSDLVWITAAVGRWTCTSRWSLGGYCPTPQMLGNLLEQNVARQSVIESAGGRVVALLQLANVNEDDGHANLELLMDPDLVDQVDGATASFVEACFEGGGLRKLYIAGASDELVLPPCVATTSNPIGRLTEHERRDEDRHVDVEVYELWLDDWRRRNGARSGGTA